MIKKGYREVFYLSKNKTVGLNTSSVKCIILAIYSFPVNHSPKVSYIFVHSGNVQVQHTDLLFRRNDDLLRFTFSLVHDSVYLHLYLDTLTLKNFQKSTNQFLIEMLVYPLSLRFLFKFLFWSSVIITIPI